MPNGTAAELLSNAYSSYRSTTMVKAELTRDNPEVFGANLRLIRGLDRQLSLLRQTPDATRTEDVNRNCLRQYLWKTLAALSISTPLASELHLPIVSLYDNPEYGQFAAVLTQVAKPISADGSGIGNVDLDTGAYRRILRHLLSVAAPKVHVVTENDMVVFLKDRASFNNVRQLIGHLDELLAQAPVELASAALERDLRRVLELIDEEVRRVRRARTNLWLPLEILSTRLSKAKAVFDQESEVYSEAREALAKALAPSDQWVFALLRLFDPQEVAVVEKKLAAESVSSKGQSAREEWWITGDLSLPWYVTGTAAQHRTGSDRPPEQ